jgi:hypothetical protein
MQAHGNGIMQVFTIVNRLHVGCANDYFVTIQHGNVIFKHNIKGTNEPYKWKTINRIRVPFVTRYFRVPQSWHDTCHRINPKQVSGYTRKRKRSNCNRNRNRNRNYPLQAKRMNNCAMKSKTKSWLNDQSSTIRKHVFGKCCRHSPFGRDQISHPEESARPIW